SRIPESQIALKSGLDEEQTEMFVKIRHQNAHNMSLLVYDQPVAGAVEALQTCQKSGIDLVVMTMRRQRELDEALHRCHFRKFFTKNRRYCIGDNYHKTKDIHDKPLLMANAIASLPPASKTWMVGDTEADIISAQSQGIPIIAVLSGIRDRAQLEKHKPDLILNNLAESVEFILSEKLSKVG
ncbi:MAG: HAD family hydrolase, partial [Microcoleaceae cyanobacterium]